MRRMRWAGHVERIGEERGVYSVLVGKPEGKRPLERPRPRWVDDIRKDLQEGGGVGMWTGLENQLDATYYFILLLLGSTCFGHYYAHQQELATVMLITKLVVSFCKFGAGSVSVKL